MNLEKRLQRWRAVDLVTDDQIKRILDFEREQPSASWILYGITGLGVRTGAPAVRRSGASGP